MIAFSLLVLFATLTQGVLTTVPITLGLLIVLYVRTRNDRFALLWALISGVLLDLVSVRSLGVSSVFLVAFLSILLLYERKFELSSIPFIFFGTFLGSFLYLLLFGYQQTFLQALVSAFIAIIVFKGMGYFLA